MPRKARCVTLVAVAGTHALAIGVLLDEYRTVRLAAPGGTPLSAFIVTHPVRRQLPVPVPARNASSAPPIAPLVGPITLAPPAPIVTSPGSEPIDWSDAAKQAAAETLGRPPRRPFGFPPGGRSAITLGAWSSSSPAHHAGESDRSITGEDIEWTSDRCYVESDPPVPGEPDILARHRVTHSGCLPPAAPDPGELFKSLPAYRKYHPR